MAVLYLAKSFEKITLCSFSEDCIFLIIHSSEMITELSMWECFVPPFASFTLHEISVEIIILPERKWSHPSNDISGEDNHRKTARSYNVLTSNSIYSFWQLTGIWGGDSPPKISETTGRTTMKFLCSPNR